jgi:preprotein translocase, secE subunit
MADKKEKKSTNEEKGFFQGVNKEFKKIVWPTKDDLVKQSIVVVASSVVLGVVISAIDWVFQMGFGVIFK